MDFEPTEEQQMFRDTLREFLDKKIAPVVDKRDRQGPFTKAEVIGYYKDFKRIGIGFDPETARTFLSDPMYLLGL